VPPPGQLQHGDGDHRVDRLVAQRKPLRVRPWPEPTKQPHGISSRGCVTVDGGNRCTVDSAVDPVADLDTELGEDGSVRSTLRRPKAEQFNYNGHVNARVGYGVVEVAAGAAALG
jgi:hypothetical protein